MNIEQHLDQLKKVKILEVPDFLYQNINERIISNSNLRITKKGTYALVASVALIIVFNSFAIIKYKNSISNQSNFAEQMNLISNQNIYSNE